MTPASNTPSEPYFDDAVLVEAVVRHALHLVNARGPVDFQIKLAVLLQAAESLRSHRA